MKKNTITVYSLSTILIPVLIFSLVSARLEIKKDRTNPEDFQKYESLLNMFQDENLGNSLEPSLKPPGPYEQPMTYGLILSAESLHYDVIDTYESKERIRSAAGWLINNSDLNGDGKPGWGLPQSWDAFSDGTTNTENHPYSITTSIVLEGLLDSLKIEGVWSADEEKKIKDLVSQVAFYWLENVYIGDEESGYIGYSTEPSDMYNCPNISGMFLSNLVRMVTEHDDIFNKIEKQFIAKRIHAIANQLVKEVIIEDGLPYWEYIVYENPNNQNNQNDLVHHIYVLWGIEEYRQHFNNIEIPFTLSDSVHSVDNFLKEHKIYSYPQHKVYIGSLESFNTRPSNLWGAGMMMAFYSKYGDNAKSREILNNIEKQYGNWPNITIWPSDFSRDENFYARYAAHVLFGLSYKTFYSYNGSF